MFGFQGGESADTVARKKGYMQDAQQRWGFMTNFDLSTIKNEVQLSPSYSPKIAAWRDLRQILREGRGSSIASKADDAAAWV